MLFSFFVQTFLIFFAKQQPTAMNQQKFFFELFSDSKVNAFCGKGFYTKLDLGIVKYHFEIASGRKLQS